MDTLTFGPLVLLVRTGFDGEKETRWLPAAAAVALLAWDCDNGNENGGWYSARVVADDVDMGAWDRSA